MFESFRTRRPSTKTRLGIARLEDRSTPSVSTALVGNTLIVSGSASDPGAEIRIAGSAGKVQVFDGTKPVAAFKAVTNIDARPEAGSRLGVDLGTNRSIVDLNVRISDGKIGAGGSVRIGPGAIGHVSITGSTGDDQVSIAGLSAGEITADLGAGADDATIGKSAAKVASVRSVEAVRLLSDALTTVDVDHPNGASVVTLISIVEGGVSVSSRGGSLTLGGIVGGDVTYATKPPPTMKPMPVKTQPASLFVTGQVLGSLHMTGTPRGDSVEFAHGSRVARNLTLDLGAGNDSATFAGEVGERKSTFFLVDLGDGNDNVEIQGKARVLAPKAVIDFGAGNDRVVVADGAILSRLYLNGGTGKDTYIQALAKDAVEVADFEVIG